MHHLMIIGYITPLEVVEMGSLLSDKGLRTLLSFAP